MNPEIFIVVLWSIAVILQLRYWIWPRLLSPANSEQPPVSVVVCAHRYTPQVAAVVSGLLHQSYPDYEVVFVNDGPDPALAAYLSTLNHPKLNCIAFQRSAGEQGGKKLPLAQGISEATHSWLLVTDADCIMGRDWISGMMRHRVAEDSIVLGFAPFLCKPTFLNFLQRFDSLLITIQYVVAALRNAAYMGVGRNMLYARSVYDKVRGFSGHNHYLSGDDDLFIQSTRNTAVGVCLQKETFVYSEAPFTFKSWIAQKRRHLSASHAYTGPARLRTTVFAVTWVILWFAGIGLFFTAFPPLITLSVLFLFWFLFGIHARRLRHGELTPWYPFLALIYCFWLGVIAVLLTMKPPQSWSTS